MVVVLYSRYLQDRSCDLFCSMPVAFVLPQDTLYWPEGTNATLLPSLASVSLCGNKLKSECCVDIGDSHHPQ
jgi:hypothetical protein